MVENPLDPRNEYWHEPDTDNDRWRESYYFDFYDPEHDLAYCSSIGRRPHKGYEGSITVLIWEGDVYLRKDYSYTTENETMQVEGLRYDIESPNFQWRIRHLGEINRFEAGSDEMRSDADEFPVRDAPLVGLEADLTWSGVHEPQYYDPSGEDRNILSSLYTEHCDQAGRVTGEVTLGDTTLQIDAFGERDHSWGIRDWRAYESWRWISAIFDEDSAINFWQATDEHGTAAEGFLYLDGESALVENVDLETDFQEDEITQDVVYLDVTDRVGRELSVTGNAGSAGFPMDFEHEKGNLFIQRFPTSFEADAIEATGYGWTEYAHLLTE